MRPHWVFAECKIHVWRVMLMSVQAAGGLCEEQFSQFTQAWGSLECSPARTQNCTEMSLSLPGPRTSDPCKQTLWTWLSDFRVVFSVWPQFSDRCKKIHWFSVCPAFSCCNLQAFSCCNLQAFNTDELNLKVLNRFLILKKVWKILFSENLFDSVLLLTTKSMCLFFFLVLSIIFLWLLLGSSCPCSFAVERRFIIWRQISKSRKSCWELPKEWL